MAEGSTLDSLKANSTATILGSSFQFNTANASGGAIYNAGTNTTIGSSFIGGNRALGRKFQARGGGGGIFNSGDELTINNTTVQNNETFTIFIAGNGGGLVSDGPSNINSSQTTLEINFSSFLNNRAQRNGGGLSIRNSNATLFQTNVGSLEGDGNRAGNLTGFDGSRQPVESFNGVGGGISVANSNLTIIGGVIANNVATNHGGGLESSISNVTTRAAFGEQRTVFQDNRALVGDGGAVYSSNDDLRLRDSIFENNTSRNGGGFFLRVDSQLDLAGSVVRFNEARRAGGGLFIDEGVAINLDGVESNTAPSGPDVFEA